MSKYTFTFKKDDIFVEFSTQDKDVIEKQFQTWVASADEYAKNHTQKTAKPKTITPVVNEPPKVQEEKSFVASGQEAPVFEKASDLLKTINSIQNKNAPEAKEETTLSNINFESVLEEKIENTNFEPQKTKDHVFLNLVNSKNTTDKFHYLMITAYYLSEFEKLERFSLKQINAKLMQNLSEVIDHSMLQEAINQGFIEVLPDLTGISEVGEYRLTMAGEEFFANRIG